MTEIRQDEWPRLRELLDQALDLDRDARRRFVDSLWRESSALRLKLQRLIAHHESIGQKSMMNAMQLAAPAFADTEESERALDQARIGTKVGPYELVHLLGAGGMGAVYLAERTAEGFTHQVALKLVRHGMLSVAVRERFERERQILAALQYHGIALLFDGGQTPEGQAYYTMEYIDGKPVTDFCQNRELPVKARVKLLLQVATTLAYAHQNLIIHRDIKPSNVLVTAAGRAKLVDFGLAKLIDHRAAAAMTQAGTGPMTPAYAAPEQFYYGNVTVATDIYQFGVLCFVVLTGRLPYRADPNDGLNWARAVTEQEPMTLASAAQAHAAANSSQKPAKTHRHLTRDLDAIVRKALTKEPGDRYTSMDAMIADLEGFLDGRPVRARRAGLMYFVWRFVQRWRYAVIPAVFLLVAWSFTALIANRSIMYWWRKSHSADAEVARATAVANFVPALFQVSDPGLDRGDRLTANEILENAEKRIEIELAHDPAQRATLHVVLGEAYVALGDLPRARSAFENGVKVLRNVAVADHYQLGHALYLWAKAVHLRENPSLERSLIADAEAELLRTTDPRAQKELADLRENQLAIQAPPIDGADAVRGSTGPVER